MTPEALDKLRFVSHPCRPRARAFAGLVYFGGKMIEIDPTPWRLEMPGLRHLSSVVNDQQLSQFALCFPVSGLRRPDGSQNWTPTCRDPGRFSELVSMDPNAVATTKY